MNEGDAAAPSITINKAKGDVVTGAFQWGASQDAFGAATSPYLVACNTGEVECTVYPTPSYKFNVFTEGVDVPADGLSLRQIQASFTLNDEDSTIDSPEVTDPQCTIMVSCTCTRPSFNCSNQLAIHPHTKGLKPNAFGRCKTSFLRL